MPQTFYIESDEEIISVVGRLRKSSAEENIFVFPKRALVLQSIINLRLFQREAEKLGKRITIVSQDEVGRMLAQKAGIETENYSEDFSQKAASHLELTPEETAPSQPLPEAAMPKDEHMPHSDAIGSNDFYAAHNSISSEKSVPLAVLPSQSGTPLRVRNASPEKLTSLNSKRLDQMSPAPVIQSQSQSQLRMPDVSSVDSSLPVPIAPRSFAEQPKRMPAQDRGERLKNFYNNGTTSSISKAAPKKELAQSPQATVGKKAHMIFFVVGGISLFSLVTVALFFILPKAEVHVTPYMLIQTIDKEFNSTIGASVSSDDSLSVRIFEKEESVLLTATTTGKSGGTNQKARGTVVIYNNYSTEQQPLVATTRLESSDGKLFRLVSGVIVPAMTNVGGKQEPGAIEAQVVADQAGAEYNIESATFTIPGFKGGPKYEKFSAKSTKTMTGGGSGGASDVAVVAKIDLDTATREAKEKAKEAFLNEVRDGLSSDERILDEQIDIAEVSAPDLPSVGTVANAFDYKGTFKVRAFVFSEKAVKEKVEAASEKDMQGVPFRPVSSSITYSDSSADFASNTLRLKAHALVTMESDIDKEKLKEMLLGKNESGIKQALESFPEVKNIQVIFHPQWFVRSIPDSAGRVSIVIEPGEDRP